MKKIILILACVLSISAQAQSFTIDKESKNETLKSYMVYENHEFYVGKIVCTYEYKTITTDQIKSEMDSDEYITDIEFDGDDCAFLGYIYYDYDNGVPSAPIYLLWENISL